MQMKGCIANNRIHETGKQVAGVPPLIHFALRIMNLVSKKGFSLADEISMIFP